MAQYCPAITSRGIEEVLPLSHSDLLELQELARFACEDHGHTPDKYSGFCEECLKYVARIFAFQKEGVS